ncbi:hypothetical protein AZF37_02090 [endosymbiont 'TC1' of Trimyema compressum]|uniref:hypothetical protein n=1 Tax=endosymbiont 'TC1' of Trimyema compressum TaxID=243899 RepID=UPI0007F090AD|nr:hypothetical protein [endosymbiont 'TC1' of Trimyema compressum]AMP20126.1 hypothetical protein AZF37_02090 [endosymbiont 'TC1' of Trimyema compressum]
MKGIDFFTHLWVLQIEGNLLTDLPASIGNISSFSDTLNTLSFNIMIPDLSQRQLVLKPGLNAFTD